MAAYFTDKSQTYSTRKGPGAPGQIDTDYTVCCLTSATAVTRIGYRRRFLDRLLASLLCCQ